MSQISCCPVPGF